MYFRNVARVFTRAIRPKPTARRRNCQKWCIFLIIFSALFTLVVDVIELLRFVAVKQCVLPELIVLNPDLISVYKNIKPFECKHPVLQVESNLTSIYRIYDPSFQKSAIECCFVPFRYEERIIFDTECVRFEKDAEIRHEFIKVVCELEGMRIYKEYFAFVPPKYNKTSIKREFNVLIIGMSSVSMANFRRQMPATEEYLRTELGAIDFSGYNRIGGDIFENVVPLITGKGLKTLREHNCWPRLEECPLIWRDYKERGYVTAFVEDSTKNGIFGYYKFTKPPTDYWPNPLYRIAELTTGRSKLGGSYMCLGSKPTHLTLLNYAHKFVQRMKKDAQPFFGMFWTSSASRESWKHPRLADHNYLNFFRELNKLEVFKDTIVMFVSDKGAPLYPFERTGYSRTEERLPALLIALPPEIKNPNVLKNRKRLITSIDLHATLTNILYPGHGVFTKTPRCSLFDFIPKNRHCDDANVEAKWCVCKRVYPFRF